MRLLFTMAVKDIRILLRDRMAFFFAFFFPLIYAVFFGTLFSGGGGGSGMSVLLVDQDRTEGSRAFVAQLEEAPEINVIPEELEAAREQVRKGERVAYIVLPPGFGAARESLFSGQTPKVQLGVDPKRQAEAGLLQGVLMKYASDTLQKPFSDPEALEQQMDSALEATQGDPAVSGSLQRMFAEIESLMAADQSSAGGGGGEFGGLVPLEVEAVAVTVDRVGPQNPYEISFPQGIIWGIMGSAATFGISLVLERRRGTLVRMQTAPISRMQILGGKALACFLTVLAICAGLFLIGRLVFKLSLDSPLLLLLAVVSIAVAFVGIMMMLSVLGRTEQSAGGIGWAILMIMAMIGGGMIPLFFMPAWLQTASHVSPIKWAILAMEGALWRQFSLGEMLFPCGILVVLGVACFTVGVRVFAWTAEA